MPYKKNPKNKNIAFLTSSNYHYGGGWMRDALLVQNIRNRGENIFFYSSFFKPFVGEKIKIDHLFFKIGDVILALNLPKYYNLPVFASVEDSIDKIPYLNKLSKYNFATFDWENITAKIIRNIEKKLGNESFSKIKDKTNREILDSILIGKEGKLKREIIKLEKQLKKDNIKLINTCSVFSCKIISDLNLDLIHIATIQGYDMIINSYPKKYRQSIINRLKETVKKAHGFIAISKYYAKKASEDLDIPIEKINVVYNGIDTDTYKPIEFKKNENIFTITFLGRITLCKGPLNLVFAAKHIADKNYRNFKIIIAGSLDEMSKPYLNILKEQIALFDIEEIFEFKYNLSQEDKIKLLNISDVVVYPTTYPEPFGLVPIESMACGTPVILPNHGAFTEIINETKGGLLYKPNDSVDLAKKIICLMKNRNLLKKLSEAGLKNTRAKFNAKIFAKKIWEIYKEKLKT